MVKVMSGGGITSNKYQTSRLGQKVEPVAKAANVGGVAQQGMATAFKKEPLMQGKGYEPGKVGATGIANARQGPAEAGPGSNRVIYKSGSQSPTPAPTPMTPGRDILSEYGREVPGRRGQR
jgi:hypothetical protein